MDGWFCDEVIFLLYLLVYTDVAALTDVPQTGNVSLEQV